MDCIDAIIYVSPGDQLAAAKLAGELGAQLERAGIELGEAELRTKDRVPEGRCFVLLLPRRSL